MANLDLRKNFVTVLEHVYNLLFPIAKYNRITLLTPESQGGDVIRPFARFQPGANGITTAEASQARFKREEGYAGSAWQNPHHNYLALLPLFTVTDNENAGLEKRTKVLEWHQTHFHLAKGTANRLSDYMTDVKLIFCYGFRGSDGGCRAVLSIDCLDPILDKTVVNLDGTQKSEVSDATSVALIKRMTAGAVLEPLRILIDSFDEYLCT